MSYWEREAELIMGECKRLEQEIFRLETENARLEAALKTTVPDEMLQSIRRVTARMRHRANGIVDAAAVNTWADVLEEALTRQPAPVTACGRCGGKGYIQSTPRTFDTDSASECIDALLMARRDCPDCKLQPAPATDLPTLIESAHQYEMTDEERKAQVISFAYGNTALENPDITRDGVAKEYDKLHPAADSHKGHGWITGTADLDALEGAAMRAESEEKS